MAPKGVREEDWEKANSPDEKAKKPVYEEMKTRSCTDPLCCVIFLLFIITIVALGAYGFTEGDISKLTTPFDSEGNQCGQPAQANGADFTDYPYKFINGIFSSSAVEAGEGVVLDVYASVCVKTCPAQGAQLDCKQLSNGDDCPYSFFDTNADMIDSYCLPDYNVAKDQIQEMFQDLGSSEGAGKYIADIGNSWQTLLIMLFVTIIISVVYIWLLRFIVKPLLYISMILTIGLFVGAGAYSWQQAGSFEEDDPNYKYCQYGAYVLWVLAGLTVCCICCCWNNIMLGAALMVAASEFVAANVRIIATPLLAYTLSLIFFLWWIVSATWLYSLGEIVPPSNPNNTMIPELELDDVTFGIMWYYLFALFWITAFFMSLQKFIIAAATTLWYFDPIDDGSKSVSVCEAMCWGIWYHCGTVAFGSFLIAVVQLIRAIFEYIVQKMNDSGAGENALKKALECVIRCCLWCLDQCVKFITENAYIQCCVNNTSFCSSAWNAFTLMVRNAGRFSSLGMVDFMLMILGKGTIVSASALVTYLIADKAYPLVQQPLIPAILIVAYAYVVASLFLTIFSFSARTILHCFLLQEETSESAVDAPASLQAFLDLHPKEDDQGDKRGGNDMN